MKILLASLGLGLATAAAAAQAPSQAEVRQVIVYGDDPCPRGEADEIVVCARFPETDRYRIPEPLRGDAADPANASWAERARALEYVGRTGTQSCSTVGPGGFTGCWDEMVREARRERDRDAGATPEP